LCYGINPHIKGPGLKKSRITPFHGDLLSIFVELNFEVVFYWKVLPNEKCG
jgi:hypothetical protein